MKEEPPRNTRLFTPANNRTASYSRPLHNFTFPSTLCWHNRVYRFISSINTDNKKSESNSKPSESDQKPNKHRAWGLRTKRANPHPNFKSSFSGSLPPPPVKTLSLEKGKRVCRDDVGHSKHKKLEGERCKFSIALKKEDIEEDFLKITGVKPPRRPKRRSKQIQNQIDSVFPGCWFSEITPDLYKVNAERP